MSWTWRGKGYLCHKDNKNDDINDYANELVEWINYADNPSDKKIYDIIVMLNSKYKGVLYDETKVFRYAKDHIKKHNATLNGLLAVIRTDQKKNQEEGEKFTKWGNKQKLILNGTFHPSNIMRNVVGTSDAEAQKRRGYKL